VKVPPIRAHMEVTNSYQCFPFFFTNTAMGDRSYENRASGTSSSLYWERKEVEIRVEMRSKRRKEKIK
jgi:hypothetical protein